MLRYQLGKLVISLTTEFQRQCLIGYILRSSHSVGQDLHIHTPLIHKLKSPLPDILDIVIGGQDDLHQISLDRTHRRLTSVLLGEVGHYLATN